MDGRLAVLTLLLACLGAQGRRLFQSTPSLSHPPEFEGSWYGFYNSTSPDSPSTCTELVFGPDNIIGVVEVAEKDDIQKCFDSLREKYPNGPSIEEASFVFNYFIRNCIGTGEMQLTALHRAKDDTSSELEISCSVWKRVDDEEGPKLINVFGKALPYTKELEYYSNDMCPSSADDRDNKRVAGVAEFRPVKLDYVFTDTNSFACRSIISPEKPTTWHIVK